MFAIIIIIVVVINDSIIIVSIMVYDIIKKGLLKENDAEEGRRSSQTQSEF